MVGEQVKGSVFRSSTTKEKEGMDGVGYLLFGIVMTENL